MIQRQKYLPTAKVFFNGKSTIPTAKVPFNGKSTIPTANAPSKGKSICAKTNAPFHLRLDLPISNQDWDGQICAERAGVVLHAFKNMSMSFFKCRKCDSASLWCWSEAGIQQPKCESNGKGTIQRQRYPPNGKSTIQRQTRLSKKQTYKLKVFFKRRLICLYYRHTRSLPVNQRQKYFS